MMTTLKAIWSFIGVRGAIGIAVAAFLTFQLMDARSDARAFQKEALTWQQKYNDEAQAHTDTIRAFQNAAAEARRKDEANKKRVEKEQRQITERIERSYEELLADARARADRLRQQLRTTGAAPGGPGESRMSGPGSPTGGPDGAASDHGLSITERLIATEQAIQLDRLQQWVRDQSRVDNGSEE